jgi:hypothetical protein
MESMGEGRTGDAEIKLSAAAGQAGCIHKPLRLYIATQDVYAASPALHFGRR